MSLQGITQPVAPAAGYIGGKRNLAGRLVPIIDRVDVLSPALHAKGCAVHAPVQGGAGKWQEPTTNVKSERPLPLPSSATDVG
ncbi:MAG: hypothetical protein JWM75_1188 [Sphingomonas bacterium]|nr:hypothetical protein [Sphingomonas bacterium]